MLHLTKVFSTYPSFSTLTTSMVAFMHISFLLPLFYVWQLPFHVGPRGLGAIITLQVIAELVVITLYNKLAQHTPLPRLLAYGIWLLSFGSCFLALAPAYVFLLIGSAFQGIGNALIMPTLNNLVVDYAPEHRHGRELNFVEFSRELGGLFGVTLGILSAPAYLWGFSAWRIALLAMVALLGCIGIMIYRYLPMPSTKANHTPFLWKNLADLISLPSLVAICRNKTILLIFSGEICFFFFVGTLSFLLLFTELVGFSKLQLLFLILAYSIGNMGGYLMGGMLGDKAAKRYPNHGRIALAQVGIAAAAVIYFIIYTYIPLRASSFSLFAILIMGGGVAARIGVCTPLLYSAVSLNLKKQASALLRLVQLIAFSVSPVLCGWLAEDFYGYSVIADADAEVASAQHVINVQALRLSMKDITLLAFIAYIVIYGFMHYTFSKDRRRLPL